MEATLLALQPGATVLVTDPGQGLEWRVHRDETDIWLTSPPFDSYVGGSAGQPTVLLDPVEVAQQMRPAHLPVRGVDLRAHRRHVEDLVALRLLCQLNLSTTLANRLERAVHHPVHLTLIDQRAAVALVPGLRAASTCAGPALFAIGLAWTVRRRRLGRIVGVQVDAFLEQFDPLLQLRDDCVARRHRLRQRSRHHSECRDLRCVQRRDLHQETITKEHRLVMTTSSRSPSRIGMRRSALRGTPETPAISSPIGHLNHPNDKPRAP
jgi:hypothetical protein